MNTDRTAHRSLPTYQCEEHTPPVAGTFSFLTTPTIECPFCESRRLRAAAKRVHEQYIAGGGLGQTLAFESAMVDLERALAGLPSEGNTDG